MSENILDYDASKRTYKTNATIGQRLGNKVMDYIAMYVLGLLLNPMLMRAFGLTDPQAVMDNLKQVIENKDFDNMYSIMLALVGTAFFSTFVVKFLYYTCFEYFTKGKSLGKLATKTRVVPLNGDELQLGHCLLRTLCRFIPLSFLSVFMNDAVMWHDSISGTRVVQED